MSAANLPEIEITPALREAAERSKAWPFEEARKIVARLEQARRSGARHPVRDRLRPVGPAPYRHLRRGGADDHGADRLPRPHRRPHPDPAPLLLRRHGRAPQGSRQRAEQGDDAAISQPAADRASPTRSASTRASAPTTMPGSAASSTASASPTSSPAPPTTTAPAASTRRCSKMLAAYDEVMAIMLPSLGDERRETYSPFLPVSPTTGAVLQVAILERKLDAGTIVYRDPDSRQARRAAGHRRPASSASGRPTGRSAGRRSASTTRCRART